MTKYTFQTTITVVVDMADNGAEDEENDGLIHWDSPKAQEESALEWANSAMPLTETYEEFVTIDVPELALVPEATR